MVENDRTMTRLNDDGTVTVALVRTIPAPSGPIRDQMTTLEDETLEIMRRHAARFVFVTTKRKKTDREDGSAE